MEKIILHCDLNNFYASVECLKNEKIRNYPVAVCGNEKERHGIVLAKNDIAKGYGIKTAETVWQARKKCKNLVIVPPDFEMYKNYSIKVRKIYQKYTDYVEMYGLDECYLDVTNSTKIFGNGYEIADKIRNEVKKTLGLTISVGVSFTKDFAKLGSDMKKPDAITEITRLNFKETVWKCPAEFLLGVGKSTAQKLESLDIHNIGDIAKSDVGMLVKLLGKNGYGLWKSANGEGDDCVKHKDTKYVPKSIGHGLTLARDESDYDELWKVIFGLSQRVEKRLRYYNLYTKCIKLTIKNNRFETRDIQSTISYLTRDSYSIAKEAMNLLKKQYIMQNPVRMVTVTAITIEESEDIKQLSIFDMEEKMYKKEDKLGTLIERINEKYGDNTVNFASLINEHKNN